MWESMRGDDIDDDTEPAHEARYRDSPIDHGQYDNNDDDFPPGRGRGRGRKQDDDEIRGKPIFKKGDWECPS